MMRLMPYFLLLLMILGACSEQGQRDYQKAGLEYSVPKGAVVLEHVPLQAGSIGSYVIFEFRDECFMLYSRGYQRSMSRINCK